MGKSKKGVQTVKNKKVGRPRIKIDWDTIENYLKLGATLDDVVFLTSIDKRTLQTRCIEKYNYNFHTLIKNQQGQAKLSVRSALMTKVKNGDVSSIIYANKTIGGLVEKKDELKLELMREEFEYKKEQDKLKNEDDSLFGLNKYMSNQDE